MQRGVVSSFSYGCRACDKPFTLPEELKTQFLVTSCCYKIFHKECFTDWFKKEKSCSYCRAVIDPQKAGKPLTGIWKIFLLALQHKYGLIAPLFRKSSSHVEALTHHFSQDTECPICLTDYPQISICYDEKEDGFKHQACLHQEETIQLTHLVQVTKTLVTLDPTLAAHFQ
ncbi:hypothetical protein [Rhabdochlamydiaceae symbiont of Dictyostelium giganteum]|uniref:hypothetical protein n=1 Tax=Rhabdochlamydiaceae symbiont of Dictyostelium giganteum TaxID=3342349 RepID=UPI00384CE450